jgi:hypothetical protein
MTFLSSRVTMSVGFASVVAFKSGQPRSFDQMSAIAEVER